MGRRAVAGICPAAGDVGWGWGEGGDGLSLETLCDTSAAAVWSDDMFYMLTLHCFVLHGSDVLKTWRRNIPVFLHLLLLLTVRGAAARNKKNIDGLKTPLLTQSIVSLSVCS